MTEKGCSYKGTIFMEHKPIKTFLVMRVTGGGKPTDDTERIRFTNGHEHTFRIYRGKRGLSNPHRISIDPFLGDKYVDLAEPED